MVNLNWNSYKRSLWLNYSPLTWHDPDEEAKQPSKAILMWIFTVPQYYIVNILCSFGLTLTLPTSCTWNLAELHLTFWLKISCSYCILWLYTQVFTWGKLRLLKSLNSRGRRWKFEKEFCRSALWGVKTLTCSIWQLLWKEIEPCKSKPMKYNIMFSPDTGDTQQTSSHIPSTYTHVLKNSATSVFFKHGSPCRADSNNSMAVRESSQ